MKIVLLYFEAVGGHEIVLLYLKPSEVMKIFLLYFETIGGHDNWPSLYEAVGGHPLFQAVGGNKKCFI
jgi:hypothetical protein